MTTDLAARVAPLLTLIRLAETGRHDEFDIVWGGIKAKHRPPRPLTEMTIAEVLAWQDSIDPLYNSEAAGAYQILEDTLRGIWKPAGLSLSSRFDAAAQDRLAIALLRRRGLEDFLAGRITAEKFANALAKEWASLPVVSGPNKGRSHYAGDGLNKAITTPDRVLWTLKGILETPERRSIWATILAALCTLLRGDRR